MIALRCFHRHDGPAPFDTTPRRAADRLVRPGWGWVAQLALAVVVVLGMSESRAAQEPAAACPPVAQAPTPEQWQSAQAAARDRGFLWRLTRDGRSSWLYGTVHLGRFEWVFPGPALREAIVGADLLALELDITDPATLREVAAAMAAGPPMPDLPTAVAERLQRQVAAACLPPQALDGLHPVMRAVTLGLLDARWSGLDSGFAQEAMLAGAARARRIPIVALEKAANQVATLMPPDAESALGAIESALAQIESGTSRRAATRLAQAWADQRLEELARYEAWCECIATDGDRAQLQRLNDARNPGLADGIAALHAQGRRVLAAVGALHMTGPQALPRLLEERGFVVERIGFTR